MIFYQPPTNWIKFDPNQVLEPLARARGSILSLQTVPYQRRWVDKLQELELKREVAGTSRIEGADFTDSELDSALRQLDPAADAETRSQRQARAAMVSYRFIQGLPDDRPVDLDLVTEIHRRMVLGADDDHCPPGELRGEGRNVSFGTPPHRGVEGGDTCRQMMEGFMLALRTEFREYDPLIQAIAAHYHLAAMHPFDDGNGRTARALEALFLGRAGLRKTSFIAMSNYYYDEKPSYLRALADVRANSLDLTPFLVFALRGVDLQARRLLKEIQTEIKRELFINLAQELFSRLQSTRKRVIVPRQLKILERLLRVGRIPTSQVWGMVISDYDKLRVPVKAFLRDVSGLLDLQALTLHDSVTGGERQVEVEVNLDWPQQITETAFFERVRKLPKARSQLFTT